jgi:hypothetical protein
MTLFAGLTLKLMSTWEVITMNKDTQAQEVQTDNRLRNAIKSALAVLQGELRSSPGARIAAAILRAVGKIGS